jgi:hypothetical protein
MTALLSRMNSLRTYNGRTLDKVPVLRVTMRRIFALRYHAPCLL